MCNKLSVVERGSPVQPMALKFVKITLVLVFFCFAECAAGQGHQERGFDSGIRRWGPSTANGKTRTLRLRTWKSRGSCISYGHACWGGHGKRNGGAIIKAGDLSSNDLPNDTKWFLAKLLKGSAGASKMVRSSELVAPASADKQQYFDESPDVDDIKGLDDGVFMDYQDTRPEIEAVFPDGRIAHLRTTADRLRFLKFLKNGASKMQN